MITGGIYKNRNEHLPQSPGRIWYEADINYKTGKRNTQSIVWSNDGLIFVTYDHYDTFYEIVCVVKRIKMKKATVNLTNCKYLYELHQRFQDALNFPDYYGKNLDAFWDCINRDCDVEFVTIVGSKSIADELKPTLKKICELLEENKKYWANSDCPFNYEILS